MKLEHPYYQREVYDLLYYREPYEVAIELSQLAKVLIAAGVKADTFLELGSGPKSKYHRLASATFPFYGLKVARWLTSDVSGGDYPRNLLTCAIGQCPVDISLLPYNLIASLVHTDYSTPTPEELQSVLRNLPGKWAVGLVELTPVASFSHSFHLYDSELCRHLGENFGVRLTQTRRMAKHPASASGRDTLRTPTTQITFEKPFIYQWISAVKAINSLGPNNVTWYRFGRDAPRKVKQPKNSGDYWYVINLEGVRSEG